MGRMLVVWSLASRADSAVATLFINSKKMYMYTFTLAHRYTLVRLHIPRRRVARFMGKGAREKLEFTQSGCGAFCSSGGRSGTVASFPIRSAASRSLHRRKHGRSR